MPDRNDDMDQPQTALTSRGRSSLYSPLEYVELPSDSNATSSAGIREYWLMALRHWPVIVVLTIVFGAAGLLMGSLPGIPMYAARTTIELGGNNLPSLAKFDPYANESNNLRVTTGVIGLESEALRDRVVDELTNTYKQDFRSKPNRVWLWLGQKGMPVPDPRISARDAVRMTAASLEIEPIPQTQILEISCRAPDPGMAADFANQLVKEYSSQILEDRLVQAQRTTDFLNHQLETLQTKLQNSENQLQEYTQAAGLSLLANGANNLAGTVAEQKLSQLQQELSLTQTARLNAQSKYETVKSVSAADLPDVIDSPTLGSYQAKLTELHQQLADLSASFTSEHYRVIRVQAQISAIEEAISKEQSNIINRIKNDYQAALKKEKRLEESYSAQAQVIAEQSSRVFRYDILKREVETNRQIYNSVLQQVKEAGVNFPVHGGNVSIVDRARPRYIPSSTNVRLTAMLGLFCGLVFSGGYIALREKLDSRLKTPDAISAQIRLPQLGLIPSHKESRRQPLPSNTLTIRPAADSAVELLSWTRKHSLIAGSFRDAATSIVLGANNGRKTGVLVVGSPQAGEGKTTAVTNLGIALAEIGLRVLLIDADMHHPRLHRIFGISKNKGLAGILEDPAPFDRQQHLISKTHVPNVDLIPSGSPKSSVSKLIHSAKMLGLVEELRLTYDIILVDTPPILATPDARVLGRISDGAVLVFRAGMTSAEMAIAARERFLDDGIRIVGCLLNDWDARKNGYSRGYYSNYHQKQTQET
jgi:succinoglycan biosynthesis transport protein ExoP